MGKEALLLGCLVLMGLLEAVFPLHIITGEPRDRTETLSGIPWLARMADKAQLSSENRLSNGLQFPCPNDQALCSKLGVAPTEFRELVVQSTDDSMLERRIADKVGGNTLMALRHPRFKKHDHPLLNIPTC